MNGPISRVFVTFSLPSDSQKCLADHLEPIQKWRIAQLAWFMKLNRWKQRLLSLIILCLGPLVLMIRVVVFTLNMIYTVASAFSSIVIDYMIRNHRKVSKLELLACNSNVSGRPASLSANGDNDCSFKIETLSLPASKQVCPDLAAQRDSISSIAFESSANSLCQVAHSLQRPVIFRCQRLIETLSTPALQPWAFLFSIARGWLKICMFLDSCNSAIDKWYLKLLQERTAMLEVQQEEAQRKRRAESGQQSHHGLVHLASVPIMQSAQEIQNLQQEQVDGADSLNAIHDHTLLNTDGTQKNPHRASSCVPALGFDLQVPELEVCSPTSASMEVPPKIIASELRLRRPREPWLLLWGHLHVSKVEQVSYVICDSALILNSNSRPCRFFDDWVSLLPFLS